MLVLDSENNYGFANTTIKIVDQTYETPMATVDTDSTPRFNFLIPTVQDIGITNVMQLYQPGETDIFVHDHGEPNPLKYGFNPNAIYEILGRSETRIGVYTINLRGPSATMANVAVYMKYKIEENVAYKDEDGNQLYFNRLSHEISTDPSGEPIARDVLHIKFETTSFEEIRRWQTMYLKLNALENDTPDDEGYKILPFFAVMYRGATEWANNIYFNMVPTIAEYDENIYYYLNVFDGQQMSRTPATYSFDVNAGATYEQNYYVENVFNNAFPTMRYMTAEASYDGVKLIQKYLFTDEEYCEGTYENPSTRFASLDIFSLDSFAVKVDAGSLNPQLTNAFKLQNGTNGNETRDELYTMFFNGEIITDISNTIRYRINIIPDFGYKQATKSAINTLVNKRFRTTKAIVMVGTGNDDDFRTASSFQSAMTDKTVNWFGNRPDIRLIAACQSPMMFDTWTRRSQIFPAGYFDLVAFLEHVARNGSYFAPFAGADARWRGYIQDTMMYPDDTPETHQSLYQNRINVVMRDRRNGAYLSDQLMDVTRISDQIEFNNELIISCMLYDLIDLAHANHFKFNEAEEVQRFHNAVNEQINDYYAQWSASLSVRVSRLGTIGRAKSTNVITARIDFKDINRYTNIELYLVEE